MEVLHDTAQGDPALWQPAAALAALCGVNERTVRKWAKTGRAERVMNHGRAYYRLPEQPERPRSAGPDPTARADKGRTPSTSDLQLALVEVQREFTATAERLHTALGAAQVDAERADAGRREAELIAEVAVRDAERHQAHAAEVAAHLEVTRAELATERQRRRAAELYALTPWWKRRRRHELRAELTAVAGLLP